MDTPHETISGEGSSGGGGTGGGFFLAEEGDWPRHIAHLNLLTKY